MTNDDKDLKPCAHCEGLATKTVYITETVIKCSKCPSKICVPHHSCEDSESKALELWNTRATPQQPINDKDLKPCPEGIGIITLRSEFISNARKKIRTVTGYDIYLSEKEWDCLWYIACKIDGVENTRATPQQPSEPLKPLDEETVYEEITNKSRPPYQQWERVLARRIVAKFGHPSEKKALSVTLTTVISRWIVENDIKVSIEQQEILEEAIHSALPAQREVRYPEKRYSCKTCNGVGWWAEQVSDTEQEQKKCPDCYSGATPPDMEYNDAIDEFKKLNGG